MEEKFKVKDLGNRWISVLRDKAKYEQEAKKNGEMVSSPSINDICNEMVAFFTGLTTEI